MRNEEPKSTNLPHLLTGHDAATRYEKSNLLILFFILAIICFRSGGVIFVLTHVLVGLGLQARHLGSLGIVVVDVPLHLDKRLLVVTVAAVVGLCCLVVILTHVLVRLGLQACHLCSLGIVVINVPLHLDKRLLVITV